MTKAVPAPLVINGWTIFAHPLILDQLELLIGQVERLRLNDPVGFTKKNAFKRLAAIAKLMLEVIPQDPARAEYRQGNTLGEKHKHWFRAKFFQQYRLFFRYHAPSKVLVYAWVNDETTKRAYEGSDDAYKVFQKMLAAGHPPNDWAAYSNRRSCTQRPSGSSLGPTKDFGLATTSRNLTDFLGTKVFSR